MAKITWSIQGYPLEAIIVLPQGRVVFNEITQLADSIASFDSVGGLFQEVGIALFRERSFKELIRAENRMWGRALRFSRYKEQKYNGFFSVLIFGERRIRALTYLAKHGCSSCRSEHGKSAKSICYKKHFGSLVVPARVYKNFPLDKFFEMQLRENSYNVPSPSETAEALRRFFVFLREKNQKLSYSQFAALVNRSPQTISHALKYCELPFQVRKLVEKGYIAYNSALQIARLQEAGFSSQKLIEVAQYTAVKGLKVAETRKFVDGVIESRDQLDMLELLFKGQNEQERQYRNFLRQKYLTFVAGDLKFFDKILQLFAEGILDGEESPFSSRSILKVLASHADLFKKIALHLNGLSYSDGIYGAVEAEKQLRKEIDRFCQRHGLGLEKRKKT